MMVTASRPSKTREIASPAPAATAIHDRHRLSTRRRNVGAGSLALLLVALAGCDSDRVVGSVETKVPERNASISSEDVPTRQDPGEMAAASARAHWADGYIWADDPNAAAYNPSPFWAFNRTGSAIQVTRPAGTTGRYRVKFLGLSPLLGSRSTVQVTGHSSLDSYCSPVTPTLVSSVVEVRCFRSSTGTPVNTTYSVLVTRHYADVAFAHAHQPTSSNYAPQSSASWNPSGTMRVLRHATGVYQVNFAGLGPLAASNGGNVQVSAVGGGTSHCKVERWLRSADVDVYVRCFTRTGAPTNLKFNVLFVLPSDHLAYAWADQPSNASYTPNSLYSYNPAGGAVTVSRSSPGRYTVSWSGIDPEIFEGGNVQVTAYGLDHVQCKVELWGSEFAAVRCHLPNGTLVDSQFTVLIGS